MHKLTDTERVRLRIRLLLGLMLFLQGGILAFLWNLQVVQGHTFQDQISSQSLRRVRHPGHRGRILDRNGMVLADNRPSVGIALYPEELRLPGRQSRTLDRIDALLDEISENIGLPRTLTREQVARHYRNERMLPLLAWRDLDDRTIARWAERVGPREGVDLLTEPVRFYPFNDLLAQTLGYVGRGGMADPDEGRFHFQIPEMEGKAGLELVFDELLRGEAGAELVRIDVASYKHNVEVLVPPVRGHDVHLTLDARLQNLAERILGSETGSIVLMDPRNGEVLALATYPRYDLNNMVPFISHSVWNALIQDPRRPLVNRPVREHYAPGSTIKPFVCLAGLLSGQVTEDTTYTCHGSYQPGPNAAPMHCNNRFGHGTLDMREAIARSCNVYMWRLAEDIGYDPMFATLEGLGAGQQTGIEVDFEVSGILPTDAWKRQRHNDVLRRGDIANISIGQGFLTTTPLQMALMTATIANGGTHHAPTLLRGFRRHEEEPLERLEPRPAPVHKAWDPVHVAAIREGMLGTVMGDRGTGRNARVDGLAYAAKTGTAQYGPPGNRRYRSWMIAFAPYDNPRLAAVVLIDSGLGSGVDAAPRMQLLMQALFGAPRGEVPRG